MDETFDEAGSGDLGAVVVEEEGLRGSGTVVGEGVGWAAGFCEYFFVSTWIGKGGWGTCGDWVRSRWEGVSD